MYRKPTNTDSGPTVLSTSSLAGDTVKNISGENLGKIEDFMVDTYSGEIAYAVLSFGGFFRC